jgi:bacteriorhodopsin
LNPAFLFAVVVAWEKKKLEQTHFILFTNFSLLAYITNAQGVGVGLIFIPLQHTGIVLV